MSIKAATSRIKETVRTWGTWCVLIVGILLSGLGAWAVKSDMDATTEKQFDFACDEIRLNIAARLSANVQNLYSGLALFNTSDTVTRSDWKTFIRSLEIDQFQPGTQGIGFVQIVRPALLEHHIQSVHKEGYPGYAIRPAGPREIYSSIVYLEPFTGRNLRAFGYDMLTESVRHAAMTKARDENRPILSGKVTLVQETSKDIQAGTLLYLPVYRHGLPIATVEQRRKAIHGWIYSPYRMSDLMRGTLRGWDATREGRSIALRIYDGDTLSDSSLLYDSRNTSDSTRNTALHLTRLASIDIAGRRWTLRISQLEEHSLWNDFRNAWFILLGGTAISSLLFGLMRSLSRTSAKARQMAEQLTLELRESEQSYHNQFTTNSSVMLLIDPHDGSIVDANEAAVRFYGYSRENMLAMRISEINTLSEDEVMEVARTVPQGTGSRFQFRHRLADGSLRDVDISVSNIQFGGRAILHSIIYDITERKQAEETRKRLAERLELATRIGGIGIWEYDVADNKLVWDEQMFRLYGITPDQFTEAYDAWTSGLHPDDRTRGDDEIRMALRGEKEFNTEFRVLWPDGSTHHIRALATVQRDASGHPTHMVGTNWDITSQKLSEAMVRASEKRINQLLQSTDQGIYGIDQDGRCTFINASGLKMLGYGLEECLGQDMHDLVHHSKSDGSRYPVDACPIFLAKKTGIGSRIDDEVFWHKDGSSFPTEYSSYPIFADGTIHGAVITFTDITERKRSERILLEKNLELQEATAKANEMAAQAARANAAKGDFLANMSHEIRTPMNGVIGMTDLLRNTDLSGEQRRFTEIIRQSSESLLALINDILDFSKIEAGKLELETIDFELRGMIDDLAAAQAHRIRDKGLEFVCDVPSALPNFLRGDPGRLRQILLNLIGNAIKFTKAGWIALHVELETETDDEATLRFRVQDTGIGIPAEKQRILFQKFTQVDASTTREYGGTGLGLAISKQLVELMDGSIGIVSEEGKGAEFWFTVRFAKQGDSERPRIVPAETGETKPPSSITAIAARMSERRAARILLAEDNPTNQLVALGILELMGLHADTVANGREALRSLERIHYDLVLMDMQMPEMDGLESTRRIRDPRSAVLDHDIPIVAMTANAMHGDRETCLNAGMNDYIAKPIKPEALAQALDKWIPNLASSTDDTKPTANQTENDIPAIFDWPSLVARTMGKEDLARRVAETFRKQAPELVALLVASIESGDLPGMRFHAHTLEGSSSTVGANALRATVEKMDVAAMDSDLETTRTCIPELLAALDRILEAISDRL